MTNWNKTGKTKAIVLGLLALPNLIMAPASSLANPPTLVSVLMPLIFASVAILLSTRLSFSSSKREIVKPTWNENPLTLRRPLVLYQFAAFFFLSVGLSLLIGSVIRFHSLNKFGLTSISFGLGILVGIQLTLKFAKGNNRF